MYLKLKHLAEICLTLLFLNSCQLFKHNAFKKGQQHGYWITYTDNTQKVVLTKGRFKNGVQAGRWIYNNINGEKERIEIYRGKKIKIKHFHRNGKISLKGKAKIINDSTKLHFYYYGPWYFYNEAGHLQKISYFENGKLIKEEIKLPGTNSVYDSLATELIKLDRDFTKYRDTLSKVNKAYGAMSAQYKSVWKLSKQNDSLIYSKIESIIRQYGYPTKNQVGENNTVIFYIIGFAPVSIKENYIELFRKAAKENEIAARDFAYFEDKLNVAKYGWQIYGTQYKYDKNYKAIYYPVKKLSELNDRRKQMNLEAVDLLQYNEIAN